MPKVLRIINRFNLGGPTFNAAYLTKYMAPEFETLLIGGSNDQTEESSMFIVEKLGLKPVLIPQMHRSLGLKNDWIAYQHIKRLIKEFKPDIVHTHASKAGALGRFCAKMQGVPVIIHTFHGHVFDAYFGSAKAQVFINIERLLAKMSTKIIAISDIQREELTHKYGICSQDKIETIQLGFDLTRFFENTEEKRRQFRQFYNIKEDEIAIAITGRVVPVKNHGLFVDAIKYVLERTSKKLKIFIVGDGESMDVLQQKITDAGFDWAYKPAESSNALFSLLSWRKDIDVINAGVDIVALTSLNEGTPVSIIEAQASSKPIVSTNVGGVADIVIPNQTAYLAESGNVEDFGEKLLQLVESEELRQTFSQQGREHVMEKFHYQRLVNEMSALYRRLLEKA